MPKKETKERGEPTRLLQEGDVIELRTGQEVYAKIAEKYAYSNSRSNQLTVADVRIGQNYSGLDTSYLAGKYIVTKTAHDGGSTGGGMNQHDDWPDGHHVFCQRFLPDGKLGESVNFYQTGHFSAMIEKIKPIGKVELGYLPTKSNRQLLTS